MVRKENLPCVITHKNLKSVLDRMRAEPYLWSVSDHGNVESIDPKCGRFKARRKRRK